MVSDAHAAGMLEAVGLCRRPLWKKVSIEMRPSLLCRGRGGLFRAKRGLETERKRG